MQISATNISATNAISERAKSPGRAKRFSHLVQDVQEFPADNGVAMKRRLGGIGIEIGIYI